MNAEQDRRNEIKFFEDLYWPGWRKLGYHIRRWFWYLTHPWAI